MRNIHVWVLILEVSHEKKNNFNSNHIVTTHKAIIV